MTKRRDLGTISKPSVTEHGRGGYNGPKSSVTPSLRRSRNLVDGEAGEGSSESDWDEVNYSDEGSKGFRNQIPIRSVEMGDWLIVIGDQK